MSSRKTTSKNSNLSPDTFVFLGLITLFGIFLRIFHIDARSLYGDELWTLKEAQYLGTNLQSLPYFVMLHYWMKFFGSSEFWLRLFSVLWGSLWIPAVYYLGKAISNSKTAFIAALLAATSPLCIYYCHIARFYTFFLLVSTVSIALYIYYIKTKSKPLFIWLVASNCLLIFSHFFGFVVPFFELVIYFIAVYEKGNKRIKAYSTAAVFAFLIGLLMLPSVRAWGWDFIQRYAHAIGTTQFTQSRGINLYNLAKIPATFYLLILNDYVYPLNWTLVVPSFLAFGSAFLIGFKKLGKSPVVAAFFHLLIWGGLLLVIVLMDALAPGGNGTSARYVIFLLPVLYVIIAQGVSGLRIGSIWVILLVLLNGMAVREEWFGKWASFEGVFTNWKTVSKEVEKLSEGDARIVYDGRSQDYMQLYFKDMSKSIPNWLYKEETGKHERIIWLSNDWKLENRLYLNPNLEDIQKTHFYKSANVVYPFFFYVFEKTRALNSDYYEVPLPLQLYGLEFKDLRLPQEKEFEGSKFEIHGAFAVGAKRSKHKIIVFNDLDRKPRRLLIFSNLIKGKELPENEQVAKIIIKDANANQQDFILKKSIHTDDWRNQHSKVKTFMTWRKFMAIVGWQKYEGSFREFDAHIFAAELNGLTIDSPTSISVVYTASQGKLYVWGVYLFS